MFTTTKKHFARVAVIITLTFTGTFALLPAAVSAQSLHPSTVGFIAPSKIVAITPCGDKDHGGPYTPSIDLGCVGKGNPILDMIFGVIKFLSDGVGLVVVASLIYGGIQYTMSRGDPQATAAAVNRIRSTVGALLLFIFAYAILNYVLPGAILR